MFILDSLAGYTARDAKDAESIVERVTPRLQHANCAVVLSAVKARGRPHFADRRIGMKCTLSGNLVRRVKRAVCSNVLIRAGQHCLYASF